LFADLEESIQFNLDQILTQKTRDSLNSFANAGLQSIDYAAYINQISSQISTLDVDSTIRVLEMIQNGFIGFSQVSIHLCVSIYICMCCLLQQGLANDTQDILSMKSRKSIKPLFLRFPTTL